jgi:hypothetical protein
MRGALGLRDTEDVGLQTFPVFLAVPEKTRIIGAVIDVLLEELNPRLFPGFACHEVRPYKRTVEVASFKYLWKR